MSEEPIRFSVGDKIIEIPSAPTASQREVAATRPYWSVVWPSTRALLEVLAHVPDLSGKRVLDLGCGLGALGLAAAARGADVVLGDYRPEAVDAVEKAARHNDLTVQAIQLDWNQPPEDLGTFDGILAADVFYEDGMLRGVLRFIRRHLREDGIAWVADPHRVMPGGVEGACRLCGLESNSTVLQPGRTFEGGVVLYEIWRRRR